MENKFSVIWEWRKLEKKWQLFENSASGLTEAKLKVKGQYRKKAFSLLWAINSFMFISAKKKMQYFTWVLSSLSLKYSTYIPIQWWYKTKLDGSKMTEKLFSIGI